METFFEIMKLSYKDHYNDHENAETELHMVTIQLLVMRRCKIYLLVNYKTKSNWEHSWSFRKCIVNWLYSLLQLLSLSWLSTG